MKSKHSIKKNPPPEATFVHSLFRSGSTFFYNALKLTGLYHVYHEPMHEVIASLPTELNNLTGQKEHLKALLRHNFLSGGYFDEYTHLLPTIKKTFSPKLSFDLFFMDAHDNSAELKTYIDTLIEGSHRKPVLQCTRTVGRVKWIKANYQSKHIFLLRNPWDQWYSYKVDNYISSTPRLIYSQPNLPAVLKDVMNSRDLLCLPGDDNKTKLIYSYAHPISPEADYCLFFGLWLYAYITGRKDCDVVVDMDEISSNINYREQTLQKLAHIGLASIDFSDANLHRAIFTERERSFYQIIEGQVLEIFRKHDVDADCLLAAREYLEQRRAEAFVIGSNEEEGIPSTLEDAARMREVLLSSSHLSAEVIYNLNLTLAERDTQIGNLNQDATELNGLIANLDHTLAERDTQIGNLNQDATELNELITNLDHTLAERDEKITSFNQVLTERDEQISSLNQTVAELDEQIANFNQVLAERDDQIGSLNQTMAELGEQIANLNHTLAERDEQIDSLNKTMAEHGGHIANLSDETVRRGEWALRLDLELKEERTRLLIITKSNSWRLTLPLREARRWVSTPKQQTKRYVTETLRIIKPIYQSLPLDYQTKALHRNFLAKYFPGILLRSGSHQATIPVLSIPTSNTHNDTTHEISEQNSALSSGYASSIVIPLANNPLVSVIIPIYGKVNYTLRCLASIAINLPQSSFEVIVIDDCSPDNSADLLSNVTGIRLISNDQNQGFIRSCNVGANAAKGKYLYFLNNDTEVTFGWMDELVRTFHEFPETGLAGSKLIYPDGRLQEAGGIIWQDGSAWNFGRFQDPLLPVYNYAREVDYCSGASIMIPKDLFTELGGFDEHYLPAYCEDSDLALKIRDHGYRVIYQPLSTVIHYEGVTSGTDTSEGTKAYQIENSKKLFERWKEYLQTHQPTGMDADNAKDRRATRRALVIDHCTPTPNQDAGSITVLNLILLLREMNFQVTFIPEDNFLYMPEYTTALQRVGIEVLYAPFVTNVEQHVKDCGDRYDLAFLFRPGVVTRHLKMIRKFCPKAKVLYHTVDLHFLRMSREAELQSDKVKQKEADKMKQCELAAIRASDASIVHSTAEFELLHAELPDAILHVFPLIMNVQGTSKSFSERRDIVFVGGYQHTPNVDAVQYFATEIMPLLRKQLPGVRFYAVGSKPPADIQALASEDIIITGFVEDLTPLLDKMRVSVAPLRYGAGIKGKIGSAIAVGLPVVATPLAAEGMLLSDGDNILVGEGTKAFADAVVKLYQDEALWKRISQNGLTFAENSWGAEAAFRILADILSGLNFRVTRNNKQLTLYAPDSNELTGVDKKKQQSSTNDVDEAYQKKIQQELAIYEKQVNVHDLPDIYHYWSNKYLAPIFKDAGFTSIAQFFSSNLLEAKNRTGNAIATFISVGAGNCDLEVSVAKNLVNSGFNDFILECLEINPVMLDRGKEIAKENGVLDNMSFVEADFNTWVARKKYDGVIANQSLHHVTRLEHLFDQISNALHSNGSFIISDMIGRNGHQRWPESLEIVNKFWKELPESYKFNVLLNRLEKKYDNWDCSKEGFEGVRAQDVLPLLLQRFQCEKFIGFGSAIDIFVDRCFGHNFNRESAWDRDFIDRVHTEDEAGLANGILTPTHMMAIFVKKLHCTPYYSREIDPTRSVRVE